MRILITRPQPQADELAALLQQVGIDSFVWPCMTFQLTQNLSAFASSMEALSSQDITIFVSPRAVEFAWKMLSQQQQNKLQDTACVAIGPSTAKALKEIGVRHIHCSDGEANSEAVLKLPLWNTLPSTQNIYIFRGDSGREFLFQELQKQGFRVHRIECYHRVEPVQDIQPLLLAWQSGFDVVLWDEETHLKFRQCFVLAQKRIFILTYTARLWSFERYQKDFEKVLHSFKILERI